MENINQDNIFKSDYEIISDFDQNIIPMFNWKTYSNDFTYTVYFKSMKIGTITLIPFRKEKDWNVIFADPFPHKSLIENNKKIHASHNINNNSSFFGTSSFFGHRSFFGNINYHNLKIKNEIDNSNEEKFCFCFKEDIPEYKEDIRCVMTVTELNNEMSGKSLNELDPTLQNIFKYLLHRSYSNIVHLLNQSKNNIY